MSIIGEAEWDRSGRSVSKAGDINGDGLDDLLIGAYGAKTNGISKGKTYVIFGSNSGLPAVINLSDLNGTDGIKIIGETENDRSGRSVSSAGDINGDGIDDFLIGAYGADPNGDYSGKTYVVFGVENEPPPSLIEGTPQNDTLNGTADNDQINGLEGSDRLNGKTGNDTLDGGPGNDKLFGQGSNDLLFGQGGKDLLNGGPGADTMEGGAGNDTYIVAQKKDVVIEAAGAGNDLVKTPLDYILGDNIERLTLTGNKNRSATGNSLNNKIIGNKGDNLLVGEAGKDRLTGKNGNDILVSGAGNDILTGGGGADEFQFNSLSEKMDTLKDFVSGTDKITISQAGFSDNLAIGTLPNNQLVIGTQASDSNDYFIYNENKGLLFFDANGSGDGGRVRLAKLTGAPTLTAGDIEIF